MALVSTGRWFRLEAVWSLATAIGVTDAAAQATIPHEARAALTVLVREVQEADYHGDLKQLRQIHERLKAFTGSESWSRAAHYWRGFALWRRALNAANEQGQDPGAIAADFQGAADEFRQALAIDSAWVEARIGLAAGLMNVAFFRRADSSASQRMMSEAERLLREVAAVDSMNPRFRFVHAARVYWAPPASRGDRAHAIALVEDGLRALAHRPAHAGRDELEPSWGEAELHMIAGFFLANLRPPELTRAEAHARAALRLRPDWHYVRDILLPQIRGATPQSGDSSQHASFVVRLGHDTIGFETFTRTARKLTGDVVMRPGLTRVLHYEADVAPDGSIGRMQIGMRSYGWREIAWDRALVEIRNDSAFTTVNRTGGAAPVAFQEPVHHRAMPMPIFSYAIFEAAIRQARPTGRDTVEIDAVWFPRFQAGGVERMRISSPATRRYVIRWNTAPVWHRAELDASGRMVRFDGLNSTVGVEVERVAAVDAIALAQRWAAADSGGRTVAAFSIPDTTTGKVGAAELRVVYTAPLKRGRKIFGGVVKLDSIWRTGANQATVLTTSRDLDIAGTRVPAGSYSLWTIVGEGEATLIINRQTGQWGTNHDPAQDLVRLPAVTTTPARVIDRFEFRLEPLGENRARLVWAWDDREFSVPLIAPSR